jgi:hypothetical protein
MPAQIVGEWKTQERLESSQITFALQGLADLSKDDPNIRPTVMEILREATRKGTPAMKARGRKLLSHLERE